MLPVNISLCSLHGRGRGESLPKDSMGDILGEDRIPLSSVCLWDDSIAPIASEFPPFEFEAMAIMIFSLWDRIFLTRDPRRPITRNQRRNIQFRSGSSTSSAPTVKSFSPLPPVYPDGPRWSRSLGISAPRGAHYRTLRDISEDLFNRQLHARLENSISTSVQRYKQWLLWIQIINRLNSKNTSVYFSYIYVNMCRYIIFDSCCNII